MWVLFWYYLAPYYLLKKYVFKKAKHVTAWSAVSAIAIVFLVFSALGNTSDDDEDSAASSPKTHVVVKKIGTKELTKIKAKRKVLLAEEKKKQDEYDKLSSELKDAKDKKEEQEKEQKEQPKAAAKKATQIAKQSRQNESAQSSRSTATHHSNGGGNHGDLDTAETGKIVGNVNSKIYHVPGQAGYHMNSANAVYFNSEQDAINAGYRKAKR